MAQGLTTVPNKKRNVLGTCALCPALGIHALGERKRIHEVLNEREGKMKREIARREFMKGAVGFTAIAIAMLTGGCELTRLTTERIRNRPIRKDLARLSPTDPIIETYKFAVTQMKALPSGDPRNWTKQAEIHNNFCPHGNWYFLPWHRAYLHYFEEICRELSGDNSFALPYWNWASNPSVPSVFWGGAGNPLFHTPRGATETSVANAGIVGRPNLENILNEPNFLVFASQQAVGQRDFTGYGRLEGGPHNYVHGFVGGTMGTFLSPLDPIFWTHHNMIECCWVNWNLKRQHPNTNDSNWLSHSFTEFADRTGNPVSLTVNQTLLFPLFAYQFEECFPDPVSVRRKAFSDRELEDFVRRGARVKLEFLDRAILQEDMLLEIQRPLSKPLLLKGDSRSMLSKGTTSDRVLLTVGDIALPHGSDLYVRVFINRPDANESTPIDDPHYAGSFAFFNGHQASGKASAGTFIVDLTDAVGRLKNAGELMSSAGEPTIQLVAVPHQNRDLAERQFRIGRLELGIAKPPSLE